MTGSLTARITWLTVVVAVVSSVLAGGAAARWMLNEERHVVEALIGADPPLTYRQLREVESIEPPNRVARAIRFAVVVGGVVGLSIGAATARVMTRPLRRTAAAAHDLRAGRRDVRVPVEGPSEVADVAASLNALAAALSTSEERQRRFLLGVSHELRTPLTAVRGFAESIADGVVTGDEAKDAGAVILAEAHRLDRLVSDLLDLARLEADDFRLELADVDLDDLVARTTTVWAARATGLTVRAEVLSALATVRTDPGRLRQVLDGLLANATRLTPAGGVVVVAATRGPEHVQLQVRDSGPGIRPEDRPVAFAPGALRTRYHDERPSGAGIGLSLVHGLVTQLGGTIGLADAPEGGAAFIIWLPLSPTPA